MDVGIHLNKLKHGCFSFFSFLYIFVFLFAKNKQINSASGVFFQHTMFSHHMIITYRSEQVKTFFSVWIISSYIEQSKVKK